MSNFLAHFIGRPILVLMAALTIGVIGFVSATKLQVAMMPSGMASANVSLFITANDMTPNEVEEQVYEPLEGELMTIPGVKNVWGSCYAGGCRVGIEMSPALDPRLAAAEVRDRLQRARTQWPAHVDRWFSWRETSDSIPLMFFAFALPDHSQRWFEMIDKEVKPKLEALDGVGQVSVWGMVDESVRILFDRDKLRALRLNISTILNRLRNDNLSVPVGELEDADTSYIVRADLRYHDLETIRGLPIGRGLRLREVAEVRPARSLRDSISRVNGKSTAMGLITQAAGSNTVDTAKNVRALLDEISERPELDGLKTIYMFDQGEFIEHSLKTLVRSALTGGALAFLVLLLFLRRLKMTLVITLSLPLSLLVALSVIYMTGDSLNILSMAGLTIALGMLVDNSIVVLENIYRIKQHGVSWYQACVRGVQEVGTAVFLATITTIAVFLPVIFAGDNPSMQTALLSFGLPLCMALAASLFVALVLLPSMTAFVHRNQEAVAVPTSTSHKLGSRFAALQTRLLEFGLRYRFATLLILVGLAVG
ncbi:MAG: efflux RND transporter permease subunit, partial [Planctomycetota bacterium]|nr:efflux RND transporter permease subunit [Planctomycetota bacterium]